MPNIDYLCAERGRAIGTQQGVEESLINHALGVLQENGVYAMFLFCASRGDAHRQPATHIGTQCTDLLSDEGVALLPQGTTYDNRQDLFIRLGELAGNLSRLLFAKDLLERTLTYARYHAKAQ